MLPLCLGDDCRLSLSFSQNSPILVTLPILPTWLLVNQCFIKPIQVTNLYRVQDHCPTAPHITHTYTHTLYTHIHTHANTQIHTHTNTHTCTYIHTHTCIHTHYTHINIHTRYTHTYTYTHILLQTDVLLCNRRMCLCLGEGLKWNVLQLSSVPHGGQLTM